MAFKGPSKGPTKVVNPRPAKFVRGTWPPTPEPMYQQTQDALRIKPGAASTRDYAKQPPLDGNTGTTGLT